MVFGQITLLKPHIVDLNFCVEQNARPGSTDLYVYSIIDKLGCVINRILSLTSL